MRARIFALFLVLSVTPVIGNAASSGKRPLDPKICEMGLIKPIFSPLPMRDRVQLIKRAFLYYSFIEPARQLRHRPNVRSYVKEQMLYGIPNNAIGYLIARLLQALPRLAMGDVGGLTHFLEAFSVDGLGDIAQTYVGFNASNWARQVVSLDEGLRVRSRYFFSIYATFMSHYLAALFIESSRSGHGLDPLYRQGLAGMSMLYPFLSQFIKVDFGEPFLFNGLLSRSDREAIQSNPENVLELMQTYRERAANLAQEYETAEGSLKSQKRRELFLLESRLKWLRTMADENYRFSFGRQFLRVVFARELPDFSEFSAHVSPSAESVTRGMRRHARSAYVASMNYASGMIVMFWVLRWAIVGEPGSFEGLYQHGARLLAEHIQTPHDILLLTNQMGAVSDQIAQMAVEAQQH